MPTTSPATAPGARARPSPSMGALHLAALSAFAFAQPLFEVLRRDAEFLLARDTPPGDVLALALALGLGVPAVPALLVGVARLLGPRPARGLHLALVALLAGLVFMAPVARWAPPPGAWVPFAAGPAGVAFAVLYRRWSPLRTLLSVLAVAPPLFVAAFLLDGSIGKLVAPPSGAVEGVGVDSRTPVVFVVLDEFPVATLLDEGLTIDARLFPNFARLAGTSTWYRNATTIRDHTAQAIMALLTGRRPDGVPRLPIAADNPRSLFTLLAPTHRMRVKERVTRFDPTAAPPGAARDAGDDADGGGEDAAPGFAERMTVLAADLGLVWARIELPDAYTAGLPDVIGIGSFWGRAGGDAGPIGPGTGGQGRHDRDARTRAFRTFLHMIDRDPSPTLYYLHLMLPHSPWVYLPSGTHYPSSRAFASEWGPEGAPTALAYQRHVLQTGHLDALIGELLDRLALTRVLDRCVLVVTGDHGISFRPGTNSRLFADDNLQAILHVPLFIKAPGQRQGRVDDRNAESIDVLPTVAEAMGVELPWPVDGVSLLDPAAPDRPLKVYFDKQELRREVDGRLPGDWPDVERKAELFGAGPGWEGVLAMGPRPELRGRPVAALRPTVAAEPRAVLSHPEDFARVDLRTDVRPCLVEGRVEADGQGRRPAELAVVVNGVVEAVTAPHGERGDFAVLLPEDGWHDGANAVDVYALEPDGSAELLTPPGRRPAGGEAGAGEGRADPGVVQDAPVPELRLDDGRRVPVLASGLQGGVFRASVEDDGLLLVGWAADTGRLAPAAGVAVFADGRHVATGPTGVALEWPVKLLGAESARPSGFRMVVPLAELGGAPDGRVRVYAVSDDRAVELQPSPDALWIHPDAP